jgi:hypothetical protein
MQLQDIKHHNGPVIVGKGLLDAFEESIKVIFTDIKAFWKRHARTHLGSTSWLQTSQNISRTQKHRFTIILLEYRSARI